jgi:outer membrane protein
MKFIGLILLLLAGSTGFRLNAAETNKYTFTECVSHALTSNLNVREQQLQWLISKWSLRREYFAFEPALTVSATHRNNERENNVEESLSQLSPFFEERNWEYSAAIEGAIPIGGRFRLGYSLTDISNNLTNGTFDAEFEDEFSSFAGVNYTQPLLQGAGRTATLARLRLAASQSDSDLHELRRQVMSIVSLAGATYWNLVMAQKELRIREESIGIAESILADNEARVKAGKMSDLEVYQAQAGVALRKTKANDAQQTWIEAVSDLKQIFADSSPTLLLATEAPHMHPVTGDFESSMKKATRLNPDYLKALLEIDQEEIRLKFAKNQKWPQLDLEGSYGFNGLGDTISESWDDVQGQDFDSWTVGVVLRMGLGGGGQGDSELAAAHLRKQQALLRLKNTEVALANGIISSINRVKALAGSIKNYKIVTDYNKRLLAVELTKLEQGKSDSRKVLEIEEELFESRSAELSSMIDYQLARLALQVAQGGILHDLGLDIFNGGDIEDEIAVTEQSRDTDVQWPLKHVTTTSAPATLADTGALRKELIQARTSPLKKMFNQGILHLKTPRRTATDVQPLSLKTSTSKPAGQTTPSHPLKAHEVMPAKTPVQATTIIPRKVDPAKPPKAKPIPPQPKQAPKPVTPTPPELKKVIPSQKTVKPVPTAEQTKPVQAPPKVVPKSEPAKPSGAQKPAAVKKVKPASVIIPKRKTPPKATPPPPPPVVVPKQPPAPAPQLKTPPPQPAVTPAKLKLNARPPIFDAPKVNTLKLKQN